MKKSFTGMTAIIVLAGCNSPSTDIHKRFEKVNQSIGQADTASAKDNRLTPEKMKQENILLYIDSLKKQLEEGNGESTVPVEKVLVASSEGMRLFTALQNVYRSCRETAADKASVDNIFTYLRGYKNAAAWVEQNFKGIPTVAAITLLNKYSNDCAKAMDIAAVK